jgi:hypothetical protein
VLTAPIEAFLRLQNYYVQSTIRQACVRPAEIGSPRERHLEMKRSYQWRMDRTGRTDEAQDGSVIGCRSNGAAGVFRGVRAKSLRLRFIHHLM